MKFLCVLKFSSVGLALQVFILIFVLFLDISIRRPLFTALYWPWLNLGAWLDRSSGGGGHAMAGGTILAHLLGILVYSLLVGAAICYVRRRRSNS